jgi:hypothetical protein
MLHKFFLIVPLLLVSFDQPRLVKIKVTEGISVSLPREWNPMDAMDFTERYPSVRAPLAAYTNDERTVDFSVNISATRWPDANLEIASQFFKASIRNMFDRVEMLEEGIREVNGKSFVYFKFESRVNGTKNQVGNTDPVLRFTYLQYLIQPQRTIVFSFNCPRREREQWEKASEAMMKSIKIK